MSGPLAMQSGVQSRSSSRDAIPPKRKPDKQGKKQPGSCKEASKEKSTSQSPFSTLSTPTWQSCRGAESRPREDGMSVVSYNILAQCYVKTAMFPGSPSACLKAKPRIAAVKEVLSSLDADILCLQEVDEYSLSYGPFMAEQGYTSVYVKRPGNKKDGSAIFFRASRFELLSSEAIDYDDLARQIATSADLSSPPESSSGREGEAQGLSVTVEVTSAHTSLSVDPNPTSEEGRNSVVISLGGELPLDTGKESNNLTPSPNLSQVDPHSTLGAIQDSLGNLSLSGDKTWAASSGESAGHLFKEAGGEASRKLDLVTRYTRNCVGVMGLLRVVKGVGGMKPGDCLVVCSTHLYWDPAWEDVKLAQARYLRRKLELFWERSTKRGCDNGGVPVILGGDFNSLPGDSVYAEMTGPRKSETSNTSPKFELQSAYRSSQGSEPEITTFVKAFHGTIDYIFLFNPAHVDMCVTHYLPLPSLADLREQGQGLPNHFHPSDHMPLGVCLDLRRTTADTVQDPTP